MDKPKLIQGGIAIDDRGSLSFVNDFDFGGIKRFYMVENHQQGFVRAWHAHKKEMKCVMVVAGSALIGAVKIDDWKNPSRDTLPEKFVVDASIDFHQSPPTTRFKRSSEGGVAKGASISSTSSISLTERMFGGSVTPSTTIREIPTIQPLKAIPL